ncbi:MAG: hypothetical protein ACOC71_06155 [Hyphomicrobiales bacterium]
MNAFLSILALASFALFLGIIAWFVRETDLIVMLSLGVVLAAIDFVRTFRASRQNGR